MNFIVFRQLNLWQKKCYQYYGVSGFHRVFSNLINPKNGFELYDAPKRFSAWVEQDLNTMKLRESWVSFRTLEELLPAKYVKDTVDANWMKKQAQLSWSDQGPKLAKEFLNRHGIHLIIEAHLPKTYLDGAVCISASGNPVVALTLRYDKLDNFWCSLMHELVHIALHVDGTETWYLDNLDAEGADEVEQEADALAQESFIPSGSSSLPEVKDVDCVQKLASKLHISPCIVAGRIRYERNDHSTFGKAFRDKVRSHFQYVSFVFD